MSLTAAGIAPVSYIALDFFLYTTDYSISSLRTFLYLPGSSVCGDPGNYIKKNLKTNSVINKLMSILFSFQLRNFIKLNKSKD